jgi:hypothetical protein
MQLKGNTTAKEAPACTNVQIRTSTVNITSNIMIFEKQITPCEGAWPCRLRLVVQIARGNVRTWQIGTQILSG